MVLIDVSRVPKHIAIIMDGNGRWAQLLGRPRPEGHRAGSAAVRRTVRAARRLGVRALTLYAFSEQNWERPQAEVDGLMGLLEEFLVREQDEILSHRIQLRAIGDLDRLPAAVRRVLDPLRDASDAQAGMVLTLALSYGGREEMLAATRALAGRVAEGTLDPARIDLATLEEALPSMRVGPVDLLIRTGGEQRISNFLLWGAAYAELSFSDRLWPDFTEQDLYAAIASFQSRDRRFGRVHALREEPHLSPRPSDGQSFRA